MKASFKDIQLSLRTLAPDLIHLVYASIIIISSIEIHENPKRKFHEAITILGRRMYRRPSPTQRVAL